MNSNFRCKKRIKKKNNLEGMIFIQKKKKNKKKNDQLRRNNLLCANHLELSQFMNPTLKNRLIYCAVPTLFDVPNKPKKIKLSRPPPKKGLYKFHQHQHM